MADNIRRMAIMTTYQNLTLAEKETIDRMADRLVHAVKTKTPKAEFGRLTAIEVLGALGMLIASERDHQ